MNDRKGGIRIGLFGVAALAILTLLVMFYSTVSGAVDRSTQRRAGSADNARLSIAAGATVVAPRLAALTTASR